MDEWLVVSWVGLVAAVAWCIERWLGAPALRVFHQTLVALMFLILALLVVDRAEAQVCPLPTSSYENKMCECGKANCQASRDVGGCQEERINGGWFVVKRYTDAPGGYCYNSQFAPQCTAGSDSPSKCTGEGCVAATACIGGCEVTQASGKNGNDCSTPAPGTPALGFMCLGDGADAKCMFCARETGNACQSPNPEEDPNKKCKKLTATSEVCIDKDSDPPNPSVDHDRKASSNSSAGPTNETNNQPMPGPPPEPPCAEGRLGAWCRDPSQPLNEGPGAPYSESASSNINVSRTGPDGQTETDSYSYYPSSDAPETPGPGSGNGQPGDGDGGDGEPCKYRDDCDNRAHTGECGSGVVCSGDGIMCEQLKEDFLARCALERMQSAFPEGEPGDWEAGLPSADDVWLDPEEGPGNGWMNGSGALAGQCPTPFQGSVLGVDMEISFDGFCAIAQVVGVLVIVTALVSGAVIIAR